MSSNWPYPRIVAHRGGGTLAPENTIAALQCGLTHGFRAVEFDVMLAHDGVPVLMHDERRGRTVPGCGAIAAIASTELVTLDAGGWFDATFSGEPVPTYQQAFAFCHSHGIWMNVEIKPAVGFEHETGRVVGQMTRDLIGTQQAVPLFSSFSDTALQAARAAAPSIPRGWLVDVIPGDWLARLRELDAVALHTNQKRLAEAQAVAVTAAGFGLFCYTVNDVARANQLLGWGVDGFCTDRIDLIDADFAVRFFP